MSVIQWDQDLNLTFFQLSLLCPTLQGWLGVGRNRGFEKAII